jgi:predicted nucleic acid-binding protein
VILLDTNLRVRITSPLDRQCAFSRTATQKLRLEREQLVIVPQNLYEFWAVATRTAGQPPIGNNGLGMSPVGAGQWLDFFQRRFTLLPDRSDLPARWQTLVKRFAVRGFRSHDVRLVAAMESHGITRLLTFNRDDFKSFAITAIDPASV